MRLMDQLYSILYFKDNSSFPFVINRKEESYGRMIAPGLGICFISSSECNWPTDVIKQKLNVVRQYGMGHACFRGRFLTDNTEGIYDSAEGDFTCCPALVLAMT